MAKDVQGAVDEATEGFKDAVKARLSNPLLGSFALTWLLVNHRVVMVLLSGMSIEEKFKYLDSAITANANESQLHMLWIPLGAALLFAFLWPILGMGVERFNLWVERKSVARQLASKNIEVLPMKDVIALRSALATHVGEAEKLRGENKKLQVKVAAYKAVVSVFRQKSVESNIRDHLLGQKFGVYTSIELRSPHRVAIEFNSDGSLVGTLGGQGASLPQDLAFWFVEGNVLNLKGIDGAVARSFEFDARTGHFVGAFFSDPNYLRGLVFAPTS
ncbi:hypothetical protein ABB26_09945 [Stenotrophomonas humi]|uniref:Uncharacterized protein n=1 Tax=Stenotrophomonas humi TaxID=405444 RepID=A0A0R0CFN9_9GAMM|nr:hypothetical protein [Stenotrophomonas humi]KRG63896.1 hypothetical protein ABB26_09945 [Stenotrophomonas humi]